MGLILNELYDFGNGDFMKRTVKSFAIILAIVNLALLFCACGNGDTSTATQNQKGTADIQKVSQLFDYVFDAGTYTTLDYEFADKYFAENYDNYGGGCTAVAKVNDKGDTIVGRNMDLNISNKAAYVFRTNVEGCYKTVGLTYTFRDISPDFEDVKENGLNEEFSKVLPFMSDDVLNEKGLYIEINMRNAEFWPTGDPKFSCSGTNPESKDRIYMFEVPRYVGEHCANVEEAVEYIKSLDIYSKNGYWNYCFLIADASGKYGVLELACNNVYWNDMHQAQANFYVTEELNEIEELKAGVGRYDTVMAGIDRVQTEDEMFDLINSVRYSQFYEGENCNFDYRSDLVGSSPRATYDLVMKPETQELIKEQFGKKCEEYKSKTRQELQDENSYWESSFTEVINCNEKTLFVRFFENDEKTMTLSFDF